MNEATPPDPPSPPPIDDAATAKSLRWLIQNVNAGSGSETSKPAAHLQNRLAQPDGGKWLAERLLMPPFAPLTNPGEALVEGRASLKELEELKQRCKEATGQATSHDVILAGVAGYFFAIGAALLHHQRYLSSQPIHELRQILIDLATVVDEPWSSFLSQAAFAEPTA